VSNEHMLQEGDIVVLRDGPVYTSIPKHFAYANRKGCFDEFVNSQVDISGEFEYLQGRYVVYKTILHGGSTGRDAYPDGWHVWCERIKPNDRIKVDFYQSGCFGAMRKDEKAVGKAKRAWNE